MLVAGAGNRLRALSFTVNLLKQVISVMWSPPANTRATTSPEPSQRRTSVSSTVSERQAREVAEAARESEWKLPSFGKELFLGNFRLDLIHPPPKLDPQAVEKGERFLSTLRE